MYEDVRVVAERDVCRQPYDQGTVVEGATIVDDLCKSILFVGENNPISARAEHALYPYPEGCAGHRLQSRILNLSESVYMACWRTNLCNGPWGLKRARTFAEQLLSPDHPWKTIIMLGRKVASAFADFSAGSVEPFGIRRVSPNVQMFVSLPHPSGRNLIWNQPGRIVEARAVIIGAVESSIMWST